MSAMTLSPASPMPVMVLLATTGGLINGVQTTMYALAAHVYPAAMRATGVGAAVSIGRSGAVLSGYVGAWALEYRGNVSFFAAMALAMAACWVGLALVTRHVQGRIRRAG
jgi:AAHS family 4-hydroxybenzoate transporter-like MFS transporter